MTLADYITRLLREPFCWGKHDCVTFCANWVKEKTGHDYLAGLGTWTTAKEGMRLVKEMGGLEKALDDRLTRIHPNLAQDGDIGLYRGRMCIFSGSQIVGPGEKQLVFLNRMEAECAWSC